MLNMTHIKFHQLAKKYFWIIILIIIMIFIIWNIKNINNEKKTKDISLQEFLKNASSNHLTILSNKNNNNKDYNKDTDINGDDIKVEDSNQDLSNSDEFQR